MCSAYMCESATFAWRWSKTYNKYIGRISTQFNSRHFNLILETMMSSHFRFLLFFAPLILGNTIGWRVLIVARMLLSKYCFVLILALTFVLLTVLVKQLKNGAMLPNEGKIAMFSSVAKCDPTRAMLGNWSTLATPLALLCNKVS